MCPYDDKTLLDFEDYRRVFVLYCFDIIIECIKFE